VHSALKIEPALERHALDGVVLEPVRTANALDDMKDRVDGNPASRPGVDPTDRPERSA